MGAWYCHKTFDYRDGAGVRRRISCETRRQAEDVLSQRLRESRHPVQPVVDTNITVAQYAERWLALIAAGLKPRTVETHRTALRLHLLPTLGRVKIRLLQKGHIKTLWRSFSNAAGSRRSPRAASRGRSGSR
jgi:hypothetical protein